MFLAMVLAEGLLVLCKSDECHIVHLLELVEGILERLLRPVLVIRLHPKRAIVEVSREHGFSVIHHEEEGEPHGPVLAPAQAP